MKRIVTVVMAAALFAVAGAAVSQDKAAKPVKTSKAAAGKTAKKEPKAAPEKAEAPPAPQQSPVALANMANMYYRGLGVPQDYAKALYLYRKSAEAGHAASMIATGAMYESGLGTPVDYAQAMAWYQRAAKDGYASAQVAIGELYRKGRGVARDNAAAAGWYRKAADQGQPEGQCRLGYLMVRGWGVAQDIKGGQALLETAAEMNNGCAQHYLAFMYMNGMITILPDTQRAMELDKAAAGNGDAEAAFNVARANEMRWLTYATQPEAFNWYEISAVRGYPLAMDRLVKVYENGELEQKADPQKAELWRKRARDAWATWPEQRPDADQSIRFMPLK